MGRKLAWEKKDSELKKGNKNYLLSALSSTSYHPQSHAPLLSQYTSSATSGENIVLVMWLLRCGRWVLLRQLGVIPGLLVH